MQLNTKGPATFSFRFEGDGLGPLSRNGAELFDRDGNVIEGEAEPEDGDGEAGE